MSRDPLTNIQNGHCAGEMLISAGYLGPDFLGTMPEEEISRYADHLAGQFDIVSDEERSWFSYGIEEAIKDARR